MAGSVTLHPSDLVGSLHISDPEYSVQPDNAYFINLLTPYQSSESQLAAIEDGDDDESDSASDYCMVNCSDSDGNESVMSGSFTDHSDYDAFLKALHFRSPEDGLARLRKLRGDPLPGTCSWVLSTDLYMDWDNSWRSPFLVLEGCPGMGKTMISSFLVQLFQDRAKVDLDLVVSHFFCHNDSDICSIVSSLIGQILRAQPALFKHAQDYVNKAHHQLISLMGDPDTLWDILHAILENCKSEKIIVFVDGIDVLPASQHGMFLTRFIGICSQLQKDGNCNTRFFLTHRPHMRLESIISKVGNSLYIERENIKDDVSLWIEATIDKIFNRANLGWKSEEETSNFLYENADDTFLWASVIFDNISNAKTSDEVKEALVELPQELNKVYADIFENFKDAHQDDMIPILQLVAVTEDYLTKRELSMVIAARAKDGFPSSDPIDKFIDGLPLCHPLLYVDPETEKVVLAHPSLEEYLFEDTVRPCSAEKEAHQVLFEACWKCITSDKFSHGQDIIRPESGSGWFLIRTDPDEMPNLEGECPPFVSYAISNWISHAVYSIPITSNPAFTRDSLSRSPALRDAWLLAAVAGQSYAAIQALLQNGANPNIRLCEEGDHAPPESVSLIGASISGNKAILELLLKYGADVNITDRNGWTPLHHACKRNNKNMVGFLLNNKADPSMLSKYGNTPLHLAVHDRREGVVRLLLENSSSIPQMDSSLQSLLEQEITCGHTKIVRLLLAKADTLMGEEGRLAMFHNSIRHRRKSIASLLARDEYRLEDNGVGRTALHKAVLKKDVGFLKLFCTHGTLPQADVFGWTALHLAAWKGGRLDIMETLLSKQDGLNILDKGEEHGLTPLQLAAMSGHDELVRALVFAGAGVNITMGQVNRDLWAKDPEYGHGERDTKVPDFQSQLDMPSRDDYLLSYAPETITVSEAYMDRMGGYRAPPLVLVVEHGNNELVKFLLDHGANIEGTGYSGGTPLIHAAATGHADTVELLLSAGANIHAEDRRGRSALFHSIVGAHGEIIQILLSRNAKTRILTDVELLERYKADEELLRFIHSVGHLKEHDWEWIFVLAAGEGWTDVMKELIRMGVNLESTDPHGDTALIAAAREGKKEAARLLLNEGADYETMDSKGCTALTYAMAKEAEGIVRPISKLRSRKYGDTVMTEPWRVSFTARATVARLLIARGARFNATESAWDLINRLESDVEEQCRFDRF